ncbi:MAG: N-acetyltransferase [Cohnella sp.]|nr:N-acetyltransferase [Cohnella sp.]
MTILVRTETPADYAQVREANVRAFGGRDDEANLVERIRKSEGFIPYLSLVAETDGRVAGHLLLSKAAVVNEEDANDVIVLAPIAVLPEYQRQGIGSQLITEGLLRCKELGFGLVLLIGHPAYYPKFGFKPARPIGLELKQFEVPDDVFMVYEVLENTRRRIEGELQYPKAFFE